MIARFIGTGGSQCLVGGAERFEPAVPFWSLAPGRLFQISSFSAGLGGLYKMEPKELANVPADELAALLPLTADRPASQVEMFN